MKGGGGPKSSACPSKPRETKLLDGTPRDFCWNIPEVLEKFEEKTLLFKFRPLQNRESANRAFFEAPKLVSTQTLLLKHHYRRQGESSPNFAPNLGRQILESIDEGQITHLICARLKYDLYDFFRGVLSLLPVLFLVEKDPQNTP